MTLKPAFIVDMSGTILDCESGHENKLITVCRNNGVTLTKEDFNKEHTFDVPSEDGSMRSEKMKLYGAGDTNIYYWLLNQKPELKGNFALNDWLSDTQSVYVENSHLIKLTDGIGSFFYDNKKLNRIVALNTNAAGEQTDFELDIIKQSGIELDFILNGNDVGKPKPHPDGFLVCHDEIKCMAAENKEKAIILPIGIDDSENGGKAIWAASDILQKENGIPMPWVHMILDGKKPVTPPKDKEHLYAAVKHPQEIEFHVQRFLKQASAQPV